VPTFLFGVHPCLPLARGVPDREPAAVPHQGRPQETWLRERPLEEALRGIARHVEAESPEARALSIDEGRGREPLGEASELASRGRALVEINEVDWNPPLGEEALRLARVLAIPESEDLDRGRRAGQRRTSSAFARSSRHTLIGIGGVPGAPAVPTAGPW